MQSELVFLRENIEVLQNSPLCEVVIGHVKGGPGTCPKRGQVLWATEGASDLPRTSFSLTCGRRGLLRFVLAPTPLHPSAWEIQIFTSRSPSSKHPRFSGSLVSQKNVLEKQHVWQGPPPGCRQHPRKMHLKSETVLRGGNGRRPGNSWKLL